MKVAIVGYGVEGRVAAEYWSKQGARIMVCDANPDLDLPQDYEPHLGDDPGAGINYLAGLGNVDLIVRTPGIRPDVIVAANPLFPGLAKRITSSTREFFAQCPAPIIGVTGTKGKGTTSTLITKILEAAGNKVWLGGNIGRSPLEFLSEVKPNHIVVLELSSFQLLDLDRSPQIAVGLMIAPEHLNWHTDMTEYVAAKANLFKYQRETDRAVFKLGNKYAEQIASTSPAHKFAYTTTGRPEFDFESLPSASGLGAHIENGQIIMGDTTICKTSEVGLLGPHNLENICAAVTAVWDLVDHDPKPVRQAVTAFKGLEHRLELAGEVRGVKYYDDSFATTPETAIAAINAFTEPKVMILGGSDKGAGYDELARAVQNGRVIHALLIGDQADSLQTALKKVGFTHVTTGLTTMAKMVEVCATITEPGDVVLLSPACASFGLFKNYKDRGDQFKAAVAQLEGANA